MSPTLFPTLIIALRERLTIIQDRALRDRDPEAQLRQLQSVSGRIEALQGQLPPGTDPQLLHYFQRCSYDKALAWLEAQGSSGRETERTL